MEWPKLKTLSKCHAPRISDHKEILQMYSMPITATCFNRQLLQKQHSLAYLSV